MITDMPDLFVGHHNISTGIRTSKYITYITRGTFTVCLLLVMFFMSFLVDIHLVKISDCKKNHVSLSVIYRRYNDGSEDVWFTKTLYRAVTYVFLSMYMPASADRVTAYELVLCS